MGDTQAFRLKIPSSNPRRYALLMNSNEYETQVYYCPSVRLTGRPDEESEVYSVKGINSARFFYCLSLLDDTGKQLTRPEQNSMQR